MDDVMRTETVVGFRVCPSCGGRRTVMVGPRVVRCQRCAGRGRLPVGPAWKVGDAVLVDGVVPGTVTAVRRTGVDVARPLNTRREADGTVTFGGPVTTLRYEGHRLVAQGAGA